MSAILVPDEVKTPLPAPDLSSISTGTVPDDGTGDTPYSVGNKINDNFTEILAALNQAAPQAWAVSPIETTDYTVLVGSYCVRLNTTAGDLDVILPPALGVEGHCIEVVKWDNSANDVICVLDGPDVFYGTTGILTTQYETLRLRSVGNGWLKV